MAPEQLRRLVAIKSFAEGPRWCIADKADDLQRVGDRLDRACNRDHMDGWGRVDEFSRIGITVDSKPVEYTGFEAVLPQRASSVATRCSRRRGAAASPRPMYIQYQ